RAERDQRLGQREARHQGKLGDLGEAGLRAQQQRGVEIARRRGPGPAVAAAALQLLGRDHHRAGGGALLGQAARLVVGALDPIERVQDVAGRQPGRGGHDNSAAAAISAWFTSGPGSRQNARLNMAVPPTTQANSRPGGRSNASFGSSKYMILTMRM